MEVQNFMTAQSSLINKFSGVKASAIDLGVLQESLEELEEIYDDYNDERKERHDDMKDLLENLGVFSSNDHHDDDGHDHHHGKSTH